MCFFDPLRSRDREREREREREESADDDEESSLLEYESSEESDDEDEDRLCECDRLCDLRSLRLPLLLLLLRRIFEDLCDRL